MIIFKVYVWLNHAIKLLIVIITEIKLYYITYSVVDSAFIRDFYPYSG